MIITMPTDPSFYLESKLNNKESVWSHSFEAANVGVIFEKEWQIQSVKEAKQAESLNYYLEQETTDGSNYDFYETVEFFPGYATAFGSSYKNNYGIVFAGSILLTPTDDGFYAKIQTYSETEEETLLVDLSCRIAADEQSCTD